MWVELRCSCNTALCGIYDTACVTFVTPPAQYLRHRLHNICDTAHSCTGTIPLCYKRDGQVLQERNFNAAPF